MAKYARKDSSSRLRQAFLSLAISLAGAGTASAQASDLNIIVLDRDGRTLAAPSAWDEGRDIEIRLPGPLVAADKTTNICENFRVSYAWRSQVVEPEPLFNDQESVYGTITTKSLTCGSEPKLAIPGGPAGSNVLTYTLWEIVEPTVDAKTKVEIETELNRLKPIFDPTNKITTTGLDGKLLRILVNALEDAALKQDKAMADRADGVAISARKLKGLEDDTKLFAGTSDAAGVQKLSNLLDDLRLARKELQGLQDLQVGDERTAKALRAVRFRVVTHETTLLPASVCGMAKVLKIGGLVTGKHSKSIHYSFTKSPAPPGVALVLMGAYPRVTQDDRLFAIVANRALADHQYPFSLSATKVISAPPNLAPVRPTFDVTKAITSGDGGVLAARARVTTNVKTASRCAVSVDVASLSTAYRDSILPFQERFVGNEVLTVSIATYIPQVTTDRETRTVEGGEPKIKKETIVEAKVVDVLSDVKYPQVRALYRFNFATGVIFGTKKPPSFVTVKTAADDLATSPANEARYQLEKGEGPAPAFGAFLFSTYLKRVDIQDPVWRRCGKARCPGWRMLPAASVGFSITSPTENVFLGVTMEVMENVHAFVGGHNGKISELVVPKDEAGNAITIIRPDHEAADPKTRDRRTWNWSYGVTFNINILTGFFK